MYWVVWTVNWRVCENRKSTGQGELLLLIRGNIGFCFKKKKKTITLYALIAISFYNLYLIIKFNCNKYFIQKNQPITTLTNDKIVHL